MIGYGFDVAKPLRMQLTGKFVSPAPDWKHMSRVLTDYELFVPVRGKLYLEDDTERRVLQEGEYLLMPPGSRQAGYRGSDCSFYWLHYAADGQPVSPRPAEADDPPPAAIFIPSAGRLVHADRIIVMMKQLQDAVRRYRDQTLNDYLATGILCELHNQVRQADRTAERKQLQLYNDVVDYVQWHRFEPLQVSRIAAHFGYNPKYLSQLFAEFAGVTLKQFILQLKLESASYLLTDTNQSVKQIALKLGYSDSQHFMKAFKQATNLTPTEFRNAAAGRLLYYE